MLDFVTLLFVYECADEGQIGHRMSIFVEGADFIFRFFFKFFAGLNFLVVVLVL